MEGSITAYGNAVYDDEFRSPMTPEEIKSIGGAKEEIIEVIDWDAVNAGADPEDAKTYKTNIVPFNRNTVKKWRLKEEWFFDKQRSVVDVRIIGLCPVIMDYTDPNTGVRSAEKELFWIYYPDWRDVLARTKVQNYTKNNAQQRSYLGIFEKRMFASRIIQESNIMNRKISDYMIGLDAVLESERIKEEIFNLEHDMWEY